MKKFVFFLLLYSCFLGFCQQSQYLKSKIIDSIYVAENIQESFALYLPPQFDPQTLSPIVFIFDPAAQGRYAISNFIESADKYGYILVCSNDSRNGPYDRNFVISDRLFSKIFSEFNIDQRRIYLAGFSGGARLASAIAVLSKQIQGVIACGAGFSTNKDHLPSTETFSYAGIIGNEDFNFLEMENTKSWLNRLNVSNELFVTELGHRWPTQGQLLDAFDWLQLEAYKKGILSSDEKEILNVFGSYQRKAKELEKKGNLLYALYEYQRIKRNFSRHFQLDSISQKIINLESDKKVIRAQKRLENSKKEEVSLTKRYFDRLKKDFQKQKSSLKWWGSEINELYTEIEVAEPVRSKMIKRVLQNIGAYAFEIVNSGGSDKNFQGTILCYDICILTYPDNPIAYFRQMENYLNKNNEEKALEYLRKLIDSGYKDMEAIKNHAPFKTLKNNETFTQLIRA